MFENNKNQNETINKMVISLWVEKYRPMTLDDVIAPKRIRNQIQYFIDNGISRHILMFGGTGLGKTTIALILSKLYQSKFINGSVHNGIETVRNIIIPYTQTLGFSPTPKVMVIDEIDKFTNDACLAFRGVIENAKLTTRFIGTCNYPERLDGAILSRFGCKIDFNFSGNEKKEVLFQKIKRIQFICENEKLDIEPTVIGALVKKYNDMRDIIECLQSMKESGVDKVTLIDFQKTITNKFDSFYKHLFETKDILKVRKFVLENYPNNYYNVLVSMGDDMIDWMLKNSLKVDKANVIYVLANKYKNDSMNKPDMFTSLMALCSEIIFSINK